MLSRMRKHCRAGTGDCSRSINCETRTHGAKSLHVASARNTGKTARHDSDTVYKGSTREFRYGVQRQHHKIYTQRAKAASRDPDVAGEVSFSKVIRFLIRPIRRRREERNLHFASSFDPGKAEPQDPSMAASASSHPELDLGFPVTV